MGRLLLLVLLLQWSVSPLGVGTALRQRHLKLMLIVLSMGSSRPCRKGYSFVCCHRGCGDEAARFQSLPSE
jgi:hypothetical protein